MKEERWRLRIGIERGKTSIETFRNCDIHIQENEFTSEYQLRMCKSYVDRRWGMESTRTINK